MPPENAPPAPATGRALLLLGLLLLVAGVLSLNDARRDSVTADEPWHLVAGIAEARTGTWLLSAENAPLAKHLFGAAAIAAGENETPRASFRRYHEALHGFLFRTAPGRDPARIVFAARLVTVAFLLATAVAVFSAAGGGGSGLLAAALLLGNGALFAHGHLATLDVPFALFVALFAAALVRFRADPGFRNGALLAAAIAGGLATKGSGLLLLAAAPLACLVVASFDAPRRRRLVAGAFLVPVAALLLLSLYLHFYLAHEPANALAALERIYRLGPEDRHRIESLASIDPALGRYAFGVVALLRLPQAGQSTIYLGKLVPRPSAAYHVVALLLKSSIPWLAAALLGAGLALRSRSAARARLLFGCALFVLAASLPGPRIGVRHVFPVLVLLTAGAGAALAPLLAGPRRLGTALLIAMAPLAWGRSLGHFNLLASLAPQPPLADSNLDWGQDLLRLRDALPAHHIEAGDLDIAYFGGDEPVYRMPQARDLARESGPPRRYLAVSRQLSLVGPDSALFGDRALLAAGLAQPRGTFLFTAGDSIDVFDRGAGAR